MPPVFITPRRPQEEDYVARWIMRQRLSWITGWKTGRTAVFKGWFLGKQRLAAWLAVEVPRLGRSSSLRK